MAWLNLLLSLHSLDEVPASGPQRIQVLGSCNPFLVLVLWREQVNGNLEHLPPTMPTLIHSPFDMLYQGCSSRKMAHPFLVKKLFSSFNTHQITYKLDGKLFQHCNIMHLSRSSWKCKECCGYFLICYLILTSSLKWWNCVTASIHWPYQIPSIPCLYCFIICYKREEVSMGYLEGIWGSNHNITCTFDWTSSEDVAMLEQFTILL